MEIKNMDIIKSLRLIQVEKMVIILKEMEHIENILKFYEGYEAESSKPLKPIKKNIEFLKKDINNLRDKIRIMKGINKQFFNKDTETSHTNILLIIQYDYVRTQIEDMLRVIQALYNKMGQLFGEALNQYLPYPILGRRYSNNSIMIYLENYYREMFNTFCNKGEPELILGWNYHTGFKYRTFVSRDIKRDDYQDDTYNNYIDLPYWYYELPFLLPSITHEVMYIALRNPKKNLKETYQSLKKDIDNFFNDNKNNLVQKIQDIIGYDEYVEDLSKEIICDLYGYKIHGEAYINALFHDIIGEKLAKDYLKIIHFKDKNGNNTEESKLIPSDWCFLQKKDHSILRLHFLLKIHPKRDKEFKQMQEILDSIMPLRTNVMKDIKEGFESIYTHNYPNFKPSFLIVQNYLEQLLTCFTTWLNNNKFETEDIEYAPDFNEIWEKRYTQLEENGDTVPHQNNFRRHILCKVGKLDYLKNNDDKKLAYLMTLKKLRKDDKNSVGKLKDKLSDLSKNDDDKNFIVYGIYDGFTLENKENSFDVAIMLYSLLEKANNEDNSIRYFNTKQVLTRVYDTIQNADKNKPADFSTIINIELLKDANNPNGYKNIKDAIENIAKVLDGQKNHYYEADIFKSLGPKDITVIIKNASLETIFLLTKKLNCKKQEHIMRTFTMICSEINHGKEIKLPEIEENNFRLISTLRLSKEGQIFIEDYKKYLDMDKIDDIVEITGVMDIRIIWKTEKIEDIFEFYDKLTEDSLVTDYQTRIEKKYP